jgi:hypothetical protein
LFNFIAFFFLLLGLEKRDVLSNTVAFVVFLLIGFLVLTNNVTNGYSTNGFSFVTLSQCITVDNTTLNCAYTQNFTAPAVSVVNLISNTDVQYGLAFLYILFALYLIITSILRI